MLKFLISFFLMITIMSLEAVDTWQTTEQESVLNEEEQEFVQALSEMNEEDREKLISFFSLDWKETGSYKLPKSNSTLSIPDGYQLLIGDEAIKAQKLMGEPDRKHIEAIVYDEAFENIILFDNFKNGYVSLDDWEDFDPKNFLDVIINNTKEENKERRKNGMGELVVIGWIQEPILDRHTNTVYWAIEADSDEGRIVNSIAIRLGREGFEKLTWVSSKASYVPFGGELDVMLRAHSFDAGSRYIDYIPGDKVAGYGIATLVAATIGGKIVKAGGLAVLFKKLGGFIFAGLAAIIYKCKHIFKRRD